MLYYEHMHVKNMNRNGASEKTEDKVGSVCIICKADNNFVKLLRWREY